MQHRAAAGLRRLGAQQFAVWHHRLRHSILPQQVQRRRLTVENAMHVEGADEKKSTPSEQVKKPWSRPTFRRIEDGVVVVANGPNQANWVLTESPSYTKLS